MENKVKSETSLKELQSTQQLISNFNFLKFQCKTFHETKRISKSHSMHICYDCGDIQCDFSLYLNFLDEIKSSTENALCGWVLSSILWSFCVFIFPESWNFLLSMPLSMKYVPYNSLQVQWFEKCMCNKSPSHSHAVYRRGRAKTLWKFRKGNRKLPLHEPTTKPFDSISFMIK